MPGHGALGRASQLTAEQKCALVQESTHGCWRTYDEAREWVREQYAVSYSYKGLYSVLQRAGVRPKVPRPRAAQADPVVQEDGTRGAAPARS